MVNDLERARLLIGIDQKIHGIMEDLKAICNDPVKWQDHFKLRYIFLLYGFRRELDMIRDFDVQMKAAMESQMRMHMIVYLQSDSRVEREEAQKEILHYMKKELKIKEYTYEGRRFDVVNDHILLVTK